MLSCCSFPAIYTPVQVEIPQKVEISTCAKQENLLSTVHKICAVAFSILTDILLLPAMGVLLLWMLLRPSFDPLYIKKDKTPILLLHGSGFNESQWILARLFLHHKNYGSIFSVSYDDLITNDPKKGIDDCALGKVRDKILHIQKATGRKDIILIGHSMGGLVASCYAERYAKQDESTVRHVMCIASPWQGTPIIDQFIPKKNQEKRYQQMSTKNSFREELIQDALRSEKTGQRTYYTIASKADLIVPFPHSFLAPTLAHQKTFSSLGHFGIVVFPHVWDQICLWLDEIYETTQS